MSLIFVYITNPSKEVARKIAKHLLKKKLVACVNIFPINSLYWWKDKITEDKEFVLIAKTTDGNFERVKREVEEMHPYEVPCIVRIQADSNKKYYDWLKSVLKES